LAPIEQIGSLDHDLAADPEDHRAGGSSSIVINVNDPGSTGPLPLPLVGAGPNFAETMNTR
jgi:hypothetical protein